MNKIELLIELNIVMVVRIAIVRIPIDCNFIRFYQFDFWWSLCGVTIGISLIKNKQGYLMQYAYIYGYNKH